MSNIEIAKHWRTQNTEHANSGVVLIFDGVAYGWKDSLRDPQHERPGAIAVDIFCNEYIATGGNDYDGAKEWILHPAQHLNLF